MSEFESIHKKINWTAEDRERHRQIRERFKHHPSPEDLIASGEFSEPIPQGLFHELIRAMAVLRKAREQAGLSLADVSDKTGMDRAAISRLENGKQMNPTLDTVGRYAAALGKQVRLVVEDATS